jgi:methylenetetrahydrofolate dehydrogenase (NADP+)/methenyltetrahydrofolate cyclohydrolase
MQMSEMSIVSANSAALIDGKATAEALRKNIAAEISRLAAENLVPGLAVVLVGEDPASQVYVRNKIRQTKEVGMLSADYKRGADITQAELLELIDTLNKNSDIHGILVQLPLPKHIDEQAVIEAIAPD